MATAWRFGWGFADGTVAFVLQACSGNKELNGSFGINGAPTEARVRAPHLDSESSHAPSVVAIYLEDEFGDRVARRNRNRHKSAEASAPAYWSPLGRPEVVVFHIDNPSGGNHGYYRIGLGLNSAGQITQSQASHTGGSISAPE